MSELEQRSYDVAMSVEALASAWARTEDAVGGSVVVAETEVSGRLRGGVPWTLGGADALSMAVVVRPAIAPMQEALLWTVGALAAAEAFTVATGTRARRYLARSRRCFSTRRTIVLRQRARTAAPWCN